MSKNYSNSHNRHTLLINGALNYEVSRFLFFSFIVTKKQICVIIFAVSTYAEIFPKGSYMKSYSNKNFRTDTPTVVALGCFDGVHLGHSAVISKAVSLAAKRALPCAVFTFSEPPKNYFIPNSTPIITDQKEKKRLISSLGADILVCLPFDSAIGDMSAEEFFSDILLSRLNAAHIICGFNYSFGHGGRGNTTLLSELCERNGVGLTCLPPVTDNGVTVSSSAIREAVEEGDVELAARYLGRPFSLSAPIVSGQHLASRLGFPTINQPLEEGLLIPRKGVYVTRISIGRHKYFGITNVGIRPTVSDNTLCAETNIFDFNGDLYGKTVRVEFLHFLRPETMFSSVDELARQVRHDIDEAKTYIKK